jgi:integrase
MAARPNRADLPAAVSAVGLLIRFVEFADRHCKESTSKWYRGYLLDTKGVKGKEAKTKKIGFIPYLCGAIGNSASVEKVSHEHLDDWLDFRKFGTNGRHCAIRAVKRAFEWAADRKYISVSPIKRYKRGKYLPRNVRISPEQWASILAEVDHCDPFHDLLVFLRATGCRPQEARAAEVRHFNRSTSVLEFPPDESKGGEYARVIHLNPTALPIVQRLAMKYGDGPLFRNNSGTGWSEWAICSRFRRLRKKLGIPGLNAYAIRHTFAREALKKSGLDSLVIADLMGHRDRTMVAKVYGRTGQELEFMREAAARATA